MRHCRLYNSLFVHTYPSHAANSFPIHLSLSHATNSFPMYPSTPHAAHSPCVLVLLTTPALYSFLFPFMTSPWPTSSWLVPRPLGLP